MTDTEGESASITFTIVVNAAVLVATTLAEVSGDDQSAVVSSELSNPFVVQVNDQNGDALSGITVAFAVTAGGGSLSDTSVTTGADGRAESTLTLGSTAGTNTVTATAAGISTTITFTATATAEDLVATTLVRLSGNGQTGTVGKELDDPFVVEVQDQNGDALAGVTVTFAVTIGGGSISASSVTTDASGQAETTLTLGSAAGSNRVAASVSGITTTRNFNATGQAAVATTIVEISGDDQINTVGRTLSDPFVVEVRDQDGDALSGVAVAFAVTGGGGTLSATSVTTNASGRAESTLTLGSSTGTNTVTATATGIATTVTFTATAIAAAVNLPGVVGGVGVTPMSMSVRLVWDAPDAGDNPIQRYEYQVDGGAWTSTGSDMTMFVLDGLDKRHGVQCTPPRSVTASGVGQQSESVTATPAWPTPREGCYLLRFGRNRFHGLYRAPVDRYRHNA